MSQATEPFDGAQMTPPEREADPSDDLSGLDETWLTDLEDDPTLRLYLSLVRLPKPTVAKLAAHGVPSVVISEALPVLERRGMIELAPDGRLLVTPPDIAIPAYVAALERRARSTRRTAARLHDLFVRTHVEQEAVAEAGHLLAARSLVGAADLERTRAQVIASASSTLAILLPHRDGRQLPELVAALADLDETVERQVVTEVSALEVEGALDTLLELQRTGVDVRLTANLPLGILVVDGDVVVVDVVDSPASPRPGDQDPVMTSFVVRHHALAVAVDGMVRAIAAHAAPLPRSESSATNRADARTQHILALLAAGATDTVIARQVRVSQRTVERHIRAVMDSLGASTRFQAGVQAVRRGLVRTDGPVDKV